MAHRQRRSIPDPNTFHGKMMQKLDLFKISELRTVLRSCGCTASGRKSVQLQIVRDLVTQNSKQAIDLTNNIYSKNYAGRVSIPLSSPEQRQNLHCLPSPIPHAPPHRPTATPGFQFRFRRDPDSKSLTPFPTVHGAKLSTPYQDVIRCLLTSRPDKHLLSLKFQLSPQDTAWLREETPLSTRALLRLCGQGSNPITDRIPPGISSLKINENGILVVQSPERFEYRHTNRPIDITNHLTLEPNVSQCVDMFYVPQPRGCLPGCPWRVSIEIVRFDVQSLISRLPLSPRAETEKKIAQAFLDDSEVGITTTSINFSLKCPLTGLPIQLPCRSSNCSHLQCFDGTALITLGTETQKWACPICSTPAPYDSLLRDEYFFAILSQQTEAISEIFLFGDGHWSPSRKIKKDITPIILDCSNSSAPPPSPPPEPGSSSSDPILISPLDPPSPHSPIPVVNEITVIEILD